jgi:hypothetical protein
MSWEWRIDMVYERVYRCHTYKYIIRKDKRTIYSKMHFKYDEEKIVKIMERLKKNIDC